MNNSNVSVYSNRSQLLCDVFSAVSAEKVMIIPLDYGKKSFAGQAIRGNGDFLTKRPWKIQNTAAGVGFLEGKIQGLCSKHHIAREHVVLGGENLPKYTINFVHALRQRGLKFVHVNGTQCKKRRDNRRAKNNNLDLRPIAKTILDRHAQDVRAFDGLYSVLRQATRERKEWVNVRTGIMNRIQEDVSILFPGFLDEKRSGLTPFSDASLWLMSDRFSVGHMRRRRLVSLIAHLRNYRVKHAEEVAGMLKQLADQALEPPADLVDYFSDSLKEMIEVYRQLCVAIRTQENVMARLLIQTPGFYFTSLPGVAIIRAATIVSEVGVKWYELKPGNILSYSGTIPRETQTGEGEAVKLKLPHDANKILKNALLQAAHDTGTTKHPAWRLSAELGEHRLMKHYESVKERDGKTNLSTAGLMVRIMHRLINQQDIYIPDKGTCWNVSDYYECVYNCLQEKWKSYDLRGIPEENNFLLKLRQEIDEGKQIPITTIEN
jgi:transposase